MLPKRPRLFDSKTWRHKSEKSSFIPQHSVKTFPATENGGADFDGPNFADRHNDRVKQNPCLLDADTVTVDAVLLPKTSGCAFRCVERCIVH